MKKSIHPQSYDVTYKFTNGDEIILRTTYLPKNRDKTEAPTIILMRDRYTHPAWSTDINVNVVSSRAKDFHNKRFRRNN